MKKVTKISAFLLATVLSSCVLSVPSYALQSSEHLGDTNGDNKININDATAIQQHIAKLRTLNDESAERAKVWGNKKLSIMDATAIQRYVAGLITSFPAENNETETASKVKDNITIYFANNKNWSEVNARFFNRETGDSINTEMEFFEQHDNGEDIYIASVDVSKYDRVVFSNGTDETTDTPVTKSSSGYYIRPDGRKFNGKFLAGVYTYGQQGAGTLYKTEMAYPDGYEKDVYIWTPDGYNPEDKSKKYSVLYMSDGQSLFDTNHFRTSHKLRCDETVLSLMNNGGDGVIVVGIVTSDQNRFNELTPEIGEMSPSVPPLDDGMKLAGETFSDFLVNSVIPYVESNYNTNSIRGIAGTSSGGIEAFYIGMEHPDKFSYVGAISPALDFFESDVWGKYLGEKDFSGKVPRLYMYSGSNDFIEQLQCKAVTAMDKQLKSMGYPSDKIITVIDENGTHSEDFWAIYFPEMLSCGLQL